MRHLHADPRGSIVAITNQAGTSIATNTYDEYGIPDTASGNDLTTKGRFRYTGQMWIPELGMYYYKARFYSYKLGRFLQTDPIGYEDQFNLYAYVGNDPINGTDYSGMCQDDHGDCPVEETVEVPTPSLESTVAIVADAAAKTDSVVTVDNTGQVRTGGPSGGRFNGNQHLTVTSVNATKLAQSAKVLGPAAAGISATASFAGRRAEGASQSEALVGSAAETGASAALTITGATAGSFVAPGLGTLAGGAIGLGVDSLSGASKGFGDSFQEAFTDAKNGISMFCTLAGC